MNIAEILKNVPKGTKLYSPAFGEVTFIYLYNDKIMTEDIFKIQRLFYRNGKFYIDGECMLFPSRENRDWATFSKFDINELKPFDKVLVRNANYNNWRCSFFDGISGISNFKFRTTSSINTQCIPYNDDTKHLVGTTEDCPEYYKTW